jgi:hypothetical protein
MLRTAFLALVLLASCASQTSEKIEAGARDECARRNIAEDSSEWDKCLRDVSESIQAARRYERPLPGRQ